MNPLIALDIALRTPIEVSRRVPMYHEYKEREPLKDCEAVSDLLNDVIKLRSYSW